jgi:hypothetical protein
LHPSYSGKAVDGAAPLLEESLTLAPGLGNGFLTSQVPNLKGITELERGNLQSAEANFRECLTIAREPKDPDTMIVGLERFRAGSLRLPVPSAGP